MKIAFISDIHGNLEALKETINDIKKRNVDKIICLGDIIAKGTHSKECLKLVRDNCDIVISGNCDRHFSKQHDLEKLTEIERRRVEWNQKILNEEERNYLSSLPFSYEFYMSGSLIRVYHATPWTDDKAIINEDSIQTKYKMFLPTEKTLSDKVADIIIYGHIHHPYLDKLYNKTIINIGSVGESYDVIRNPEKDSNIKETTKANYFILEGELGKEEYADDISFQFIKVPYDIEKELKDVESNVEKDIYEYELREGRYWNMDKINKNFEGLGIDVNKI